MRVLFVVPSFPKLSETFIVSKFLGLLEDGFDVHILCQACEASEWGGFEQLRNRPELRSRVHVAPSICPRWRAALRWPLVFMRCLLQRPRVTLHYLRRGWRRCGAAIFARLYLDAPAILVQPELIHYEFGSLALGRTYLGEALAARQIISFRGFDLNFAGLGQANYYAQVWRDVDALHLLGQDLWQRAQRRGCPTTMPHVLIAPAIDAAFFNHEQETALQPEGAAPLQILGVGRLEWKKGYEYALAAIALLREQGIVCEYTIVGQGRHLEAVAFARHQLGLDSCVHLAGAASREEVKHLMSKAHVFLHTAVSEGFCNAVIEAQAMGLPVVCSDADGLGENVADGETGFVVPRRDARATSEKLALLARDPQLRARLGTAGRKRVLDRFQIKDQISAFAALYRMVLNGEDGEGTTAPEAVCDAVG